MTKHCESVLPHEIFDFKICLEKRRKKQTNHANRWKHKFMGEVKGRDRNQNKTNLISSFSHSFQVLSSIACNFFLQYKRLFKVQSFKSSHRHYSTNTWVKRYGLLLTFLQVRFQEFFCTPDSLLKNKSSKVLKGFHHESARSSSI